VWGEIEAVIYSYPQPVPSDDELDVTLPSRQDNSEDPENGGAEEEEGEEDDPTKPKFIKNGEFHWGRDRTRKFWHGKCSWCNGNFRSHRSFRVHRKGTCPEVKKRRAEESRADPGVPRPKPGALEAFWGLPARPKPRVVPRISGQPDLPTPPHGVPRMRAATAELWLGLGAGLNGARRPATRMWGTELGHPEAIPRPETLRADIIEGGKFYEQKVLAGFNKRRVSYYTDGTTVGPKAIYTVLASCIEMSGRCRCDFVRVFEYDIASADNIAADFAQMLVEHVAAGIVPIAVFTDGDSNLVSAFNLENSGCVQRRTGLKFIVGRCTIHNASLILNDAAKDVLDFKPFKSVVKAMINWLHLRPVKRALRAKGITQKVPRVQKAKWNTFTIAATFVSQHAEAIDAVRAAISGSPGGDLDDFDDILKALKPFRAFIEEVEGDQATLPSAFGSLQRLYQNWEAKQSNEAAAILSAALHRRFETTANGVLMDLAFALSRIGHAECTADRRERRVRSADRRAGGAGCSEGLCRSLQCHARQVRRDREGDVP
jgi:hypothetical protein